jgi:hypothetical protein
VRCDVCEHEYDEDEWDGNEFSVNASIEREVHNIKELSDLFETYHVSLDREVLEKEDDMTYIDVPRTDFTKSLQEELKLLQDIQTRSEREQLSIEALKDDYTGTIGTRNYYLVNGVLHHFKYVLNVEENADEYKHVCDDCYEVMFT